jgi:hypothetical protein
MSFRSHLCRSIFVLVLITATLAAGPPGTAAGALTPGGQHTGLGNRSGLGPTTQMDAMRTAIAAAPGVFTGRVTGCADVTPLLASQSGPIMAGNFRDALGNCYVWLNLEQSSMLTGSEICKTTLHEMGHLSGLAHSPDPDDILYSPFRAVPIPAACGVAQQATARKHTTRARRRVCPPGQTKGDYCEIRRLAHAAKADSRMRMVVGEQAADAERLTADELVRRRAIHGRRGRAADVARGQR